MMCPTAANPAAMSAKNFKMTKLSNTQLLKEAKF